jgi:hypothetical protein
MTTAVYSRTTVTLNGPRQTSAWSLRRTVRSLILAEEKPLSLSLSPLCTFCGFGIHPRAQQLACAGVLFVGQVSQWPADRSQ